MTDQLDDIVQYFVSEEEIVLILHGEDEAISHQTKAFFLSLLKKQNIKLKGLQFDKADYLALEAVQNNY